MNPSKLKKLIRKLKELADKGVGGEAHNAKRKLDELLEKSGLKLDDVHEQVRTWELTTLNEGSVILEKVIKSIVPDAKIKVEQFKSRLTLEVSMSDIDYQEAVYKYRFIWSAYNQERQLFLSAFQNKNAHLFMPERKNNHHAPVSGAMPPPPPPSMPPVKLNAGEQAMATEEQKRVGMIMSALRFWKYVKTSRMIGKDDN